MKRLAIMFLAVIIGISSSLGSGLAVKAADFDVYAYIANYPDLRSAFKNDINAYIQHYIGYGAAEGRVATGSHTFTNYAKSINGCDLSSIYDYNYYVSAYPDVAKKCGFDDGAALGHFVTVGLKEGRIGKADYDPAYYNAIKAIGDNLLYVRTELAGIDFTPVYDYAYYVTAYPEVVEACGYDPARVLANFADEGMYEGRAGRKKYDSKELEAIRNAYNPHRYVSLYPKARAILNTVGWDLKAAFDWARDIPYYGRNGLLPVVPDNGIEWFADFAFDNAKGNCYAKACAFYEMATLLRLSPRVMAGMVPAARGGITPHSWVEIDVAGETYVFDLTFDNGVRSGFMIKYGQKGTWKYSSYSQMHL